MSYSNKSDVTLRQTTALDAITHEADHLRFDSTDEAATECRAMQDVPRLARQLGATAPQAEIVQQGAIFNHLTQESKAYQSTYRSAACRDGGPYDEDPEHAGVFPYPHGNSVTFRRGVLKVALDVGNDG